MGYAYGDEEPQLWAPGDPYPRFVTHPQDYELHAWNSFFEWVVWHFCWPDVEKPPLSHWHDTAALASAMALPRALGYCGNALGMASDVAKDKGGKVLIKKLSMPHEMNDDPELLKQMYTYCLQDVVAERAISRVLFKLNPTERKVFILDQKINIRGIKADLLMVDKCIEIYEQTHEDINQKLISITGIENPASPSQFLNWLLDKGLILENCQKGTLREVLKTTDTYGTHEAISLRMKLAKTAPKKFQSIRTRVSGESRLHGNIMYHGASTGRWASTGVNLQNIARPTEDADWCIKTLLENDIKAFEEKNICPMDALSSAVRGTIIPSNGKKFVVGDYASVESRALAWLAGQEDKIEVFRGHGKMYEHAASKIFKVAIEDVSAHQRFMGKISELACGFQGGAGAFRSMAEMYGVDIPKRQAEKIKKEWRTANGQIVSMWGDAETMALEAVVNPGETQCKDGSKVKFVFKNNFLWCKLPSGRSLAYHRPYIKQEQVTMIKFPATEEGPGYNLMYNRYEYTPEQYRRIAKEAGLEIKTFVAPTLYFWGVDSKTRKWCKQNTYGGKLVENITQAVARDLMVESMLLLEAAGYKIVLTIHDEIISEVVDGTVEEFTQIMEEVPEWASGLPVKVEAYEAHRYKK